MWKKRLLWGLLGITVVALLVGGGMFFLLTLPHYAWLTFGPEERVRVLVCDRGLSIAVTPYVDGKQVSAVKRGRDSSVLEGLELEDPDGQTKYTVAKASGHAPPEAARELFATVDHRAADRAGGNGAGHRGGSLMVLRVVSSPSVRAAGRTPSGTTQAMAA